MQVSYHFSLADAQSASNALGTNVSTTTPDSQTIYIRLENSLTGCYAVSTIDLVVDPLPTIPPLTPYVLCDDTNAGDLIEVFDLSTLDAEVINAQNATVSYHETQADAQSNTAPLNLLYSSGTQTIYAALEFIDTACRAVAPVELIVDSLPATTAINPLGVCDDDVDGLATFTLTDSCLLYTSPSPRDNKASRMPSSA